MKHGHASETAYRALKHRAAHQLDTPRVFDDPFAVRFLRKEDAKELAGARRRRGGPLARGMRFALAVRSRVAEDALGDAVARGVRQYVVLGAGFDTFALRSPYAAQGLRVFEIDHPDTQAAKQRAMAAAGLDLPAELTFVPVDFATQDLAQCLGAAGFRFDEPAFFSFLGVSVYLEQAAFMETMRVIARNCAPGSEVVFDYVISPASLPLVDRFMLRLAARRCARLGEPWKTFLEPRELPGLLASLGYGSSEHFAGPQFEAGLRAALNLDAGARPPRFGMGRLMRACV